MCFQIKFVNKFEMFYQLGALQTWEMVCELFEYADENLKTGIPEIDSLQTKFSTNIFDFTLKAEDGTYLTTEDGDYIIKENSELDDLIAAADNREIQTESDQFVDFTAYDPFSERLI